MQINVTGRKPHNTPRVHAHARPTIATIGILVLGGVLSHSALAQVAATRVEARRAFSKDQVVAMHAAVKRQVPGDAQTALERAVSLELLRAAAAESNTFNSDQGPGPGPIGPGPGCNLFPAPASIGASVPLSYFGPPPSTTNRSLVGPVQLLNTG